MSIDSRECQTKPTATVIITLISIWSLIMFGSYYTTTKFYEFLTKELAIAQMRIHYEKDLMFRKWGSSLGIIYAPVTQNNNPNQFPPHLQNRDIKTQSGELLTVINPAMTNNTTSFRCEEHNFSTKLVSLHPINPKNRADSWEEESLRRFFNGAKEAYKFENRD